MQNPLGWRNANTSDCWYSKIRKNTLFFANAIRLRVSVLKNIFFSNIMADYVRKLTYFTSSFTRVDAEKHMLAPLLMWPVAGTLGHELATADKVAWQSGDYTWRVGMQTIGCSLLPVPARSSLILCFKKTNLNLQVTRSMCQKLPYCKDRDVTNLWRIRIIYTKHYSMYVRVNLGFIARAYQ